MTTRAPYLRPLDLKRGRIDLNHGGGGRAATQLVDELFRRAFDNPLLGEGDDAARLDPPAGHRLVIATDGHVISPLFFPGGDIGRLAVHGTVNDVAMLGATPRWLSAGFVLEEGLALADLARIVESMAAAARDAGVAIVTGDTKVVERGKGDGVFITTTGVGHLPPARRIGGAMARPGDAVLVSGTLADHGVAILAQREALAFDTPVVSDCAALHGLVAQLLSSLPEGAVHTLRDPTRGSFASSLHQDARPVGAGPARGEPAIPIKPQVRAACELLGLDPLYIANEGKCIVVCTPAHADAALAALRAHPLGRDAARIGEVTDDPHRFIEMGTELGGRRIVDWLSGDPLPRIC